MVETVVEVVVVGMVVGLRVGVVVVVVMQLIKEVRRNEKNGREEEADNKNTVNCTMALHGRSKNMEHAP